MKEKLKKPLRAFVFFIVTLLMILMLNSFFQPVWFSVNNYYTTKGFYKDPKNSIETIFLGSSVVSAGIMPQTLYREYGICSYNLASVSQPVDASYYWTQEAYRLHPDTLKTVVFDVSELRSTGEDSFMHRSLDYMKPSPVKFKAALEYTDNDVTQAMSYLFPFTLYHSRWSEIKDDDFTKFSVDPVNGTRGNDFMLSMYTVKKEFGSVYMKGTVINPAAEPTPLEEDPLSVFRKLAAFCEEKGLKLVLIKTPTNNWSSSLHNAIENLAKEMKLEFYDFNFDPLYSDIGLLYGFDLQDGYHLNYYGATKLSRWIGEYLTNECSATDVRNDPHYDYMKDHLALYEQTVEIKAQLSETRDVCSYIKTASVNGNSVLITVYPDAAAALTKEQRSSLKKMGLTKLSEISANDHYVAVIENGKVTNELISSDKKKDLTLKGVLSDGTGYTLTSGTNEKKEPLASCIIDRKERAKNLQGINISVYNTDYEMFIVSEVFDTAVSSYRDVYDFSYNSLIEDEDNLEKYKDNRIFRHIYDYEKNLHRKNLALLEEYAESNSDIFYYIDKYRTADNMIIISAQDDAATMLSDTVRQKFTAYSLPELSLLQFRESYIAVMDKEGTLFEQRKSSEEAIIYEEGIFRIESAGFSAGNIASIKINGEEYSKKLRGLNFVVYDKAQDEVIFVKHFDTYLYPIITSAD